MEQNLAEIIQLKVGDNVFTTTLGTLLQIPDTMFTGMFSGRFEPKKSLDGSFFIDRDGTHFRWILNFLRDSSTIEVLEDRIILQELLLEAKYYCILPLVAAIEDKLVPVSRVQVLYICKEDTVSQNIAKNLRSPNITIKLVDVRVVWPQSLLDCNTVLISFSDLLGYAHLQKLLRNHLDSRGTMVVCGELQEDFPDDYHDTLLPLTSRKRRGREIESLLENSLLGKCDETHPVMKGVHKFSANHDKNFRAEDLCIAEWEYLVPAVAINSINLGLSIGLNFAMDTLLSNPDAIRLVQNALALSTKISA